MKKIIANIWQVICYPLLYTWIQIVITFGYTIAVSIVLGVRLGIDSTASGESLPLQDEISELVASQFDLKIPILISAVFTFLIILLIFKNKWKADKFWKFDNARITSLFVCIILGAGLNTLTIGVVSLLPSSWQEQPIDGLVGDNLMLEILSFALIAPVLEEIIFRGIIQKRLTKMMKLPIAVILQALIFGVYHLNILQGTYAFVLGIILGLVYLLFDSIWFAAALHVAYNTTSIVLLHITGDSEINLLYFIIISAVIVAISLTGLIYKNSDKIRTF